MSDNITKNWVKNLTGAPLFYADAQPENSGNSPPVNSQNLTAQPKKIRNRKSQFPSKSPVNLRNPNTQSKKNKSPKNQSRVVLQNAPGGSYSRNSFDKSVIRAPQVRPNIQATVSPNNHLQSVDFLGFNDSFPMYYSNAEPVKIENSENEAAVDLYKAPSFTLLDISTNYYMGPNKPQIFYPNTLPIQIEEPENAESLNSDHTFSSTPNDYPTEDTGSILSARTTPEIPDHPPIYVYKKRSETFPPLFPEGYHQSFLPKSYVMLNNSKRNETKVPLHQTRGLQENAPPPLLSFTDSKTKGKRLPSFNKTFVQKIPEASVIEKSNISPRNQPPPLKFFSDFQKCSPRFQKLSVSKNSRDSVIKRPLNDVELSSSSDEEICPTRPKKSRNSVLLNTVESYPPSDKTVEVNPEASSSNELYTIVYILNQGTSISPNFNTFNFVSNSDLTNHEMTPVPDINPNLPVLLPEGTADEIMAQVIGHKRRGISSGETSASSSTCQLPTLPGGATPGTLTDELAALFECPVCFEIVLPPIMQCQVGHLVCASCRPKLSCCPTCRGTLGNIRNLAMEKVANNLMFPCKHKSTGCRMSLGLNEKAEHEEICEFRPYSCPCPGASCSWQGQLDKVMVHLQHSHKNITTLNGEDIVFLATEINLAGAVDWVMMQSCFGHHFMLVLEKQEKNDGHTQFFAIVQLIGSRKQAEHFAYRLELNGNRRRLIWEAMPRSSHEGVASAIMASDCLAFDNSIAQHFADNGNLGINVTISLVC